MSGPDKYEETSQPSIESFYDTLNDEPLQEKDYERAQEIWSHFGIRTLQQYHDHYLKSDVLLLADVMENFRNTIYSEHRSGLPPFYNSSVVGLGICLKVHRSRAGANY